MSEETNPQLYRVAIRNNEAGEIRHKEMSQPWDEQGSMFMWTEGNYCCDCNRALFWHGEYPGENDRPCGHGKFSALYAEFPDGRQIKIDS